MLQLTELLQQLSEIEPAACRLEPEPPDEIYYKIGGYVFFFIDGEFSAGHKDHIGRTQYYTGQPALDWLAGAVMRECERRGWDYNHVTQGGYHFVTIYNSALETGFDSPNDCTIAAESMLAAFVAACEPANR